MTFHAVDDIDDAFEATKAFLLPFDGGQWLRLALVAFFLGGAGANIQSGNVGGGGAPGGPPGGIPGPGDTLPSLPEVNGTLVALLAVVGLLVVLLALLFGVVGAIMEFVLVESLVAEEVHVRRYARRHWTDGLRLFGFRLGLTLVTLLVLAVLLGLIVLVVGGPAALDSVRTILILVLLGLPLLLVVGTIYAAINGFTTTFVVPVMLLTDRTVLGGWRRFWRPLRDEWTEYLVYVGFVFVLHLVAATVLAIVLGVVAAVLFVPLAVFGIVGLVLAGGVSPVALVTIVLFGGLFVLVFLGVSAVVRVPVITFFRYYALLVLGDTDGELDLIPDRRREIRGGSSTPEDGENMS